MASLRCLQVSAGGSEEDLSDLEIQQTLGSLAIGQTDVAEKRGVCVCVCVCVCVYMHACMSVHMSLVF